jgi:tetrapyrrole methylase family protein/MazG family protein
MSKFSKLLDIADQLLGPNGCPWDKEQTLYTLQPYLLEETHELLEAIDTLDPEKIADELGDVFYALIFIAKLGELEKIFSIDESIDLVCQKLIRRHPHVFGDIKVTSSQEIIENWDKIKKKEKTHQQRKTLFEGIPPTLPILPRAQKMARKIQRKNGVASAVANLNEETIGQKLWELVQVSEKEGIDIESALRRYLTKIEEEYQSLST